MDDGRTVCERGEAHQSSLRRNSGDQALSSLQRPVLGIVMRVYPADAHANPLSEHYTNRHGCAATCDVLVLNDGKSSAYWTISRAIILPSQPTGLDDFEEHLPRASSKYINGELYDSTLATSDVNDLDGDWVVVSFIGGNVKHPYVSNYYPSPRNTFDPQTNGEGHPDSTGAGTSLEQSTGRGRYFRRTNGVEHVITERGDVFFSTYYANGDLTPNAEGNTTKGRFSREIQPGPGGGVRVNMKTAQPLELNWNVQEDGIGLNNAHDPSLPQTNPQQTTPYSNSSGATYIRIQDKVVSFEVPNLFSVKSQNHFRLESLAYSDILVGTNLGVAVGDTYTVTVGNGYTLTSTLGNIELTSTEAEIKVTSSLATTITASALQVNAPAINLGENGVTTTVTLGDPVAATQPVIQGTIYTTEEAALMAALGVFIEAAGVAVPALKPAADIFKPFLATWVTALPTALSSTVLVGP